jgi:hypothetical protein
MKTILLASFLFFLVSSCAPKKQIHRTIEFTIKDKSTANNSFINLKISNKTASNYYLPIVNLVENKELEFILPLEEKNFFCIYKVFTNDTTKEFNWYTKNCFAEHAIDTEMERLEEAWIEKKKSITSKNLILLKSGGSIKIKVPMNLFIKISEYCNWELENYRNVKEVHIGITYPKKEKELATKFLSLQTLDSLKQMGYELYYKEIRSNKIPLILK